MKIFVTLKAALFLCTYSVAMMLECMVNYLASIYIASYDLLTFQIFCEKLLLRL